MREFLISVPSMPAAIRPVVPEDFEAWSQLWTEYLAFYETARPAELHRLNWQRILDPAEPMFAILAMDGARPLGLVNYLLHRSFWEAEDKIYLNDLYVRPAARGSGLGRGLIEAVYREADRLNCPQVWWFTAETNTTARRLYDRLATKSPFVEYYR
jgi:GNAT superfamily N-acetyltransferase